MKKSSSVYAILIVLLLLIQQIISGCTTTATKGLPKESLLKEELYKKDVQKEDLIREGLHKEELHKEEADLVSQKLYKDKCSPCHALPDIDSYSYTPEQWVKTIDGIHDTMHEWREYRDLITPEDDKKIKNYLKKMSQKK